MERHIPLFPRSSPQPGIRHFALLTGLEAAVRGLLISSMPLVAYQTLGSAGATSAAYFVAGIVSMLWGLMVPWATRHVPRRWMYSLGCGLYFLGMALGVAGAIWGAVWTVPVALMCLAMATATTFVCINAYILDYIARENLGRTQSVQMFFAAGPWAIGPMLGVWLHGIWAPLPFLVAGGFALVLLATFWVLRLGNGRQIARARSPAANPLAYLGRFFQQPRLIAGWLFAVMRSTGWWVYIIYLPIFCIEAGLGNKIGGVALSLSNALLFLAPVMQRQARRFSLRFSVRLAFAMSSGAFLAAGLLSPWPWMTVLCCMLAAVFLVLLDIIGGLPFLMAVKPSERTEMSAVYSSFRDVSGILAPGAAGLVLLVAPLPGIFVAISGGLALCFGVAGRLHPRLGAQRLSRTRTAKD